MSLSFDPATHTYRDGSRVLPSVTQILRAQGLYSDYGFADSIHKFRGHAVHKGCALIDVGMTPQLAAVPDQYREVADDIPRYWEAYSRFKQRTGFQGLIWECPFVHRTLGYAGTFDAIGPAGELILLDIKSGVLPEMVPVQLAAYDVLIREGEPVDPTFANLDWLREQVAAKVPIRKKAIRVEKNGRDTLFSATSKGDSYDSPMWTAAWRSAVNMFNLKQRYNLAA